MNASDMEYHPFDSHNSRPGQIVMITGTLLADETGIRIELSDQGGITTMWVNHPGLLEILLDEVPVWVGGPRYYDDDATVVGRLSKRGETGMELTDLVCLNVLRDDQSFRISWPRVDDRG